MNSFKRIILGASIASLQALSMSTAAAPTPPALEVDYLLLQDAYRPRGTKYTFNGQVKSITTTTGDNEETVFYNINGQIMREESRRTSGESYPSKTDYTWKNGRLVSEKTSYGSESLYTYYPDGRLATMKYGCPKNCTLTSYTYSVEKGKNPNSLNRSNTVITATTKSKDPTAIGISRFDNHGQLIEFKTNAMMFYSTNPDIPPRLGDHTSTYQWEEWARGIEIKQINKGYFNRYLFSNNGLLAGDFYYKNDKWINGITYGYHFDDQGNWTYRWTYQAKINKNKDFIDGEIIETSTRRIEYWK